MKTIIALIFASCIFLSNASADLTCDGGKTYNVVDFGESPQPDGKDTGYSMILRQIGKDGKEKCFLFDEDDGVMASLLAFKVEAERQNPKVDCTNQRIDTWVMPPGHPFPKISPLTSRGRLILSHALDLRAKTEGEYYRVESGMKKKKDPTAFLSAPPIPISGGEVKLNDLDTRQWCQIANYLENSIGRFHTSESSPETQHMVQNVKTVGCTETIEGQPRIGRNNDVVVPILNIKDTADVVVTHKNAKGEVVDRDEHKVETIYSDLSTLLSKKIPSDNHCTSNFTGILTQNYHTGLIIEKDLLKSNKFK